MTGDKAESFVQAAGNAFDLCVCWDNNYTFKINCRLQGLLAQDMSHVLVCKQAAIKTMYG